MSSENKSWWKFWEKTPAPGTVILDEFKRAQYPSPDIRTRKYVNASGQIVVETTFVPLFENPWTENQKL